MTSNKKKIAISIGIITICIVGLIILYIVKSAEHFDNNQRPLFLYKERYKCKDPNLIPAFNPDICCLMKDGELECDTSRNCRCKNKHTGICETCFPKQIES